MATNNRFLVPDNVRPEVPSEDRGLVAIITRTKNRPLLLERACASVLAQTYRNWKMIIVNDGGEEGEVARITEGLLPAFGNRLRVINSSSSVGMEAASNIGVGESRGEFVVLLDDDDSWHSDFLAETTSFLNSPTNYLYGGVVTHTKIIKEEIVGTSVICKAEEDFNSGLRYISLQQLLANNLFPPNAFLYRRSTWNVVGPYNESLPVLADWEFNLRFGLQYEIGVVPKPLSYYHQRVNMHDTAYGNTVTAGIPLHQRYDRLIRNSALRQALTKSDSLFGLLLNDNLSWFQAEKASEAAQNANAAAFDSMRREFDQLRNLMSLQLEGLRQKIEVIQQKTDDVHAWVAKLTKPLRRVWKKLKP